MSIEFLDLDAPDFTGEDAPDLTHWVCECDLNKALCGRDVSEDDEVLDAPVDCVVCAALEDTRCPHCGVALTG